MKKLALILAFMLIPCTAFGLEMLDDSTMDQVTGQAGVSIAVDDIQLFINIEKLAYIDCDGINSFVNSYQQCTGAAGAVALSNFQIDVLNINAIVGSEGDLNQATAVIPQNAETLVDQTFDGGSIGLYSASCGRIPLFYDYGQTGGNTCYLGTAGNLQTSGLDNLYGDTFTPAALSIDVTDRLPALSEGKSNQIGSDVSVGGVIIGFPTVEIYINSMSLTIVYDGDIGGATSPAINDDDGRYAVYQALGSAADYGTIQIDGITFSVLSGWLEIAPH